MAYEDAIYRVYKHMLQRCINTSHKSWPYYGGRGIVVCARWQMQAEKGIGYRNFLADMGPRPLGYTLERINNNGSYEPSNCKWASRKEQYRNRRSNVFLELNGETKTLKEWESATGIRSDHIQRRLSKGIPLEVALTAKKLARSPEIMKSAINAAALIKRAQTNCKRGHEFTVENTHISKVGGRVCRTCKRIKVAELRSKLSK